MFKWKKIGLIFNPTEYPGRSWMQEFAQAPATLVFEKFVRVYFSTRPPADSSGQYVSYTGFVDLDRFNLQKIVNISKKPILQLGDKGAFDEFGTYPTSIARRGNDIVAYYGGWTRCVSVPFNVAIGRAISNNDGKTFEKIDRGPILSYSLDEPFIISGPKIRIFNNFWYLFYIAGQKWIIDQGRPEPVYRIRVATSSDGENWKKYGKDIIDTKIAKYEAQASPDVIWYREKYHMFFCYRNGTNYRGKRGYRLGYASSDNLFNWVRDDSKVGIDVSKNGWDDETMAYPHVFELDGSLYLLYLGNQVGRYGFGLAKLESYESDK